MLKPTADELTAILAKHAKYLRGVDGGKCADLRRASLQGADLQGADLRRASLQGADLRGTILAQMLTTDMEPAAEETT